jgi:hypothetical protein
MACFVGAGAGSLACDDDDGPDARAVTTTPIVGTASGTATVPRLTIANADVIGLEIPEIDARVGFKTLQPSDAYARVTIFRTVVVESGHLLYEEWYEIPDSDDLIIVDQGELQLTALRDGWSNDTLSGFEVAIGEVMGGVEARFATGRVSDRGTAIYASVAGPDRRSVQDFIATLK